MNKKEEHIIDVLKQISEDQNKMAEIARNDNQYLVALYALTTSTTATEAAKIIEKQAEQLDAMKKTSAKTADVSGNTGRHIFIRDEASPVHIIIAEFSDKYLVTPYPLDKSDLIKNLRLINRSQASFNTELATTILHRV
ncbi:TPA: hypothetical protein JZG45_002605 [Escherichia coli]|nr:hypothetical protein [Escherichia coli]